MIALLLKCILHRWRMWPAPLNDSKNLTYAWYVNTSIPLMKKQALTGYRFKRSDSPFWLRTVRLLTSYLLTWRLSSSHLLIKWQVSLQVCGGAVMKRNGKISRHSNILAIFHLWNRERCAKIPSQCLEMRPGFLQHMLRLPLVHLPHLLTHTQICMTIVSRKLQLQATVKRFQFDLHLNLEGQHMLIRSWFQTGFASFGQGWFKP